MDDQARHPCAYLRCSTRNQARENDVEAQRHAITAYAASRGLAIAPERFFVDSAQSGKKRHRPALDELRALLGAGKVSMVIAYSLSRLARSVPDIYEFASLCQQRGAALVIVKDNIDLSSASGKLFFGMLSVINEFESNIASERTRDALAAARERGVRLGASSIPEATKDAIRRLAHEGKTPHEIGRALGIHRNTARRWRDRP